MLIPGEPIARGYARPFAPAATSPSETAALKCVYKALLSLAPTGKGRKRWTMLWKASPDAFQIAFEGWHTPRQQLNRNNHGQPLN